MLTPAAVRIRRNRLYASAAYSNAANSSSKARICPPSVDLGTRIGVLTPALGAKSHLPVRRRGLFERGEQLLEGPHLATFRR